MYKDFFGKNEEEAVEKAVEELNLKDGEFDVEILESAKKGLFKKANVKIRVHYGENKDLEMKIEEEKETKQDINKEIKKETKQSIIPSTEVEKTVVEFISNLIWKMGYDGSVTIKSNVDKKISVDIESPDSAIIIGRKGKNLDSIQLLSNVVAGNVDPEVRVVLDSENYRLRHEEAIVKNAYKIAEIVKKTGKSRLLEPMNPFERRLVHTAINPIDGVETKSEGDGLYKQVRIIPLEK